MTVSTTTTKNSAAGNGSTTAFTYSFVITAASELKVYIRTDSTGAEALKTDGTHYNVAGVGAASGGTVTFTSGNIPASGETVVLLRDTPLTQATDYVENDPFPAAAHEDALDKLTHQVQELQEEVDRSLKASKTVTDLTTPEFKDPAATRAGKFLAFDGDGDELTVTDGPLADAVVSSPADAHVLLYDGTDTRWENKAVSGDIAITSAGVTSIASGVIVNADINASAAIADSKLATISTADKVSGAAVQVDGATDGTSITIADTDKFLIDDGGTTKYVNASQVNSYTSASVAADDIATGDAAASFQTSSGAVVVDSQASTTTIDGHTGVTVQSTNSGDITLDSVADINLDAAGNDITLKAGGTHFGSLTNSSSDLVIESKVSDKDILLKGLDDASVITALTLDMSAAGEASFNAGVKIADDMSLSFGAGPDLTIEYDEDGTDTTRVVAANGLSLAPHGTSAGNTTELRFMELAAGGNNYVGFKAPDACADSVYTLPAAFPASNKILQSTDAGVLTWESNAVPASADTVTKTAAYTVVAGDDNKTILCSAASADYELALTAAATLGDGFQVTIKKSDASKFMVTVNPSGSEVIDGLPSLKLRQEHASVTLICDGSNFHIRHHSNVAVEGNCLDNSAMQVDQYSHLTRTGLGGGNQRLIDRFGEQTAGSPSARYTMSVESSGGISGKDKWFKALITTADASPGATEGAQIVQNCIGNNGVQFMGTDGLWENGVLSVDIIAHADSASSISFPATAALGVWTFDGTDRQYIQDVTIAADGVWQRVSIVIPEDSVANIAPGTTGQWVGFQLSIYAGSSRDTASGAWVNANAYSGSNTSENWTDATGNFLGFTNAKLQPGQLATPYVPRTYAEELDICKYYAEKLSYDTNGFQLVSVGGFSANNAVQTNVTYEEKRAVPAITSSAAGTFEMNAYGPGSTDATSLGYNEPGKTNFRFTAEYGGTAYTTGDVGQIRRDGTDDTYIFVNADI